MNDPEVWIYVSGTGAVTAYDTQQIKDNYYSVMGDATAAAKASIMGALNLYLDFINMFIMMLQLFGNRE